MTRKITQRIIEKHRSENYFATLYKSDVNSTEVSRIEAAYFLFTCQWHSEFVINYCLTTFFSRHLRIIIVQICCFQKRFPNYFPSP